MQRATLYATHRGPFQEGERVLLIDRKSRRYTTVLASDKTFHSHMGTLSHTELIGREEGSQVSTSQGHRLLAVRPTFADLVLEMPRTTQVIYPKDIGPIIMYGDIFPGARVLEIGMGSGALTMALLRAVGEHGQVISYEIREELVQRALQNIRMVMPEPSTLTVKIQDVYQGMEEREIDRAVIDLPEPWSLVAPLAEALVPGGMFLCFLPTVLQVHRVTQALEEDGRYQLTETFEVLHRPWHVSKRSIRPAHRMVAHTGFITTARRCASAPGQVLKSDEGDEGQEADRGS